MREGVTISSMHYAHICIVAKDGKSEEEDILEEIDQKVRGLIRKYAIYDSTKDANVEEDPDFCCHLLSEVGLRGTDLKAVTAVTNELADWVDAHPRLKLVDF